MIAVQRDQGADDDDLAHRGPTTLKSTIVSLFARRARTSRADPFLLVTVEPGAVGTYDDTVLLKIDQLMADCKQRGELLPPPSGRE